MVRVIKTALVALPVLISAPAYASGPEYQVAAENCFSVGQQEAAKRGASLASAESVSKGGKTACRIVLLYPASNNQHPRREEITVNP